MNSRLSFSAAILLLLASCGGATRNNAADSAVVNDTALNVQADSGSSLDVQPLNGYFVKNNIQVKDSLTFWLIDNPAAFDSLFGVAKTMNNKIDRPDFGTQVVVAATMPSTYYGTQIQLASATTDNLTNDAEMHFVATAQAEKNSYSTTPLWVGSIPKTGRTSIKVYTGDQLSTTLTTKE
ncbi:hypothetical protein HF324_24375 [Chitinophaga oryzae]|uniref:Uncharacterized protein n=1 Tax=Chitinophaga oryzae TaxID=2725414 RepID=A0ABX6LL05_9BACT|nr:hypothetical protein [Chitinophaga oryzae]QJB40805.1 hypothetical protein HF324_24375 [Chitinophaga oryzae]